MSDGTVPAARAAWRMTIRAERWLLASSIFAAMLFSFVEDTTIPLSLQILCKGAGVALLATFALGSQLGTASRQMAAIMGFSALGDVVLEIVYFAGAASFVIGHLLAIDFYLRSRSRSQPESRGASLLAIALLIGVPVAGFWLPHDRDMALLITVYAFALGAMAAAAWSSSFPKQTVGVGAMLFIMADLMIFAEIGAPVPNAFFHVALWPLYYFGQFMICTGVITELRGRQCQS